MQIKTQNELTALILGVRLGSEYMLSLYDGNDYAGNRHIEVSDDGCEGWRVSLNTSNGELHTGFCANEDQEEELNEVIRKAKSKPSKFTRAWRRASNENLHSHGGHQREPHIRSEGQQQRRGVRKNARRSSNPTDIAS